MKVLIFTDLDGTLLDHDTYQFEEALPAIRVLQSKLIPIIPTTSKTIDEMLAINQRLNNQHPFIAENGCIVAMPEGYFKELPPTENYCSYRFIKLVPDYDHVLNVLKSLRNTDGFDFIGFSDMTVETIANETGLTIAQAQSAKNRICSEPIIWKGSDKDKTRFKDQLLGAGMQLIKGGRFWHVLGKTNKAIAMQQLISLYQSNGLNNFTTIALGDSPNDVEMLNAADTAIVIKRKDGTKLHYDSGEKVIYSSKAGPSGWNETVLMALAELKLKSE